MLSRFVVLSVSLTLKVSLFQGWHLGEHRLPIFNKREPYETDV